MRATLRHVLAFLIPAAIIAVTHLAQPGITHHAQTLGDQQIDLLILHGKLVDGSGKKPRMADVGLRGDRIVFVGDAGKANLTAARIMDARGLVVARVSSIRTPIHWEISPIKIAKATKPI